MAEDEWSRPGDAGITLAEVVVALGVMSIVMAVATTAIVQMYRSSGRADVLSTEMIQLQTAYQELDRSVRYANAIGDPSTTISAAGDWYVEWSTVVGGVTTCNQLRVDVPTGVLQRRTKSSSGVLSGWAVMASFLVAPTSAPFTLQAASTSGYPHQRLTVDLTVRPAPGSSQAARRSTFSYTALNTTLVTVGSGTCSDMGRP